MRTMTNHGELRVTSHYARPNCRGIHTFRAVCARTGRVQRGCGNRRAAARLLREVGWTYAPSVGWCSPGGRGGGASA